MISKDYRQNKKQVLALFDDYVDLCNRSGKEVDESIQKQAEKIRDEIFNLMILGESNSGKSTFINAYLGKEVVPMHIRQCTSAIIKIRRGDKFELIARTAAGGKTVVESYDAIQAFLIEHASISDKYRSIPVTTINNEWLIKYRGKEIPMGKLLQDVANENIYNINQNEYNQLISEYVRENENDWGKIITDVEITYQLPEAMQGITIIDSPGVGAGGNVGKVADDYIAKANAIIFVKSLSGQALESSSFMNFMRKHCTNRKKESLFLVLTGKSLLQGSDFASLKEQALEMYKNDIDPEKILFVDSKMQLFLNKCRELGTEEKISKFFDDLDEAGNDFAPASKCWLKSDGIVKFNEKMEEQSNFNSVHVAIERFARVANYLQLIEFLENLENELKRYKVMYSGMLNVAKENLDDPAALEDRIKEKEIEIADVYNKINQGIMNIYIKYTDNISGEGLIMNEAMRKQAEYEDQLENFRNLPESQISDETFSAMKTMTMNAIDDTKTFRREMAKRIISECNQELIQFTDDPNKIQAEAYIPNFTEHDFDSIDADAKSKTSGYNEVERGATFLKTTEKVPYHHLKKHVKLVADSIHDRLNDDIIPKMVDNIIAYVSKCRDVYKGKLTNHQNELKEEYQRLLKDRHNNETRRANVEILEKKIDDIETGLKNTISLKGELKNYVGE